MQHHYYAMNDSCKIVPLTKEYIENLRIWRNNPDLSKFLRPIPYITEEAELRWFEDYLFDPGTYFFAVIDSKLNKMIGSVALYHVQDQSCELGKIVIGDRRSHGKGFGYQAVLLAICVGIQTLSIHHFSLDVHTENLAALSIYVRAGFLITGSHDFMRGGKELEMKIDKQRFTACNPDWKSVIVGNYYESK